MITNPGSRERVLGQLSFRIEEQLTLRVNSDGQTQRNFMKDAKEKTREVQKFLTQSASGGLTEKEKARVRRTSKHGQDNRCGVKIEQEGIDRGTQRRLTIDRKKKGIKFAGKTTRCYRQRGQEGGMHPKKRKRQVWLRLAKQCVIESSLRLNEELDNTKTNGARTDNEN